MVQSLENLANCKPYLQVLAHSSPRVQKAILKNGDKDLILSLCDLALNIINGNIEMNSQSLDRLRKHKTLLRDLAYPCKGRHQTGRGGPSVEWKRKKEYLVQRGSGAFLSALITSALGGLIGKVIGNHKR